MKSWVLAMSFVCSVLASNALATLPADQTVYYLIREDPDDAQSDVVFEIELDITAEQGTANAVEWSVTEARFAEIGTNGTAVDSWTDEDPAITSSNGLWWVSHDDVENPDPAEFNVPPHIEGTAANDSSGDDLDYAFVNGDLTQAQSGMYNGRVAGLTHSFARIASAEPIVEGENEPVEVPYPSDEPPAG